MTTAATSLLGLALPVTGELSGTWGDTVNNSITSLLDTAVAGTTTLSTDGDVTLSTTTLAANQARQAILLCSGARTAIRTITAPAQSKIYTIINATTGGYAVKLVGVGPTTGLTIPNGASAVVAWNGSDFIEIGSSTIGNLTVNGNLTVTGTSTLTGAATLTANPTLSAGTANGVAYLNGSKVVTTGSALTFDGTNLGVGGSTLSVATYVTQKITAGAGGAILQLTDGTIDLRAQLNVGGGVGYFGTYTSATPLAFTVGGTEGMRLTSTSLYTASGINVGIGTSSPGSYLSGTAKLVAYANANAQNNILVRNDNSGASASSAIVLNAYGNQWGIEIGSAAKNSNALTFQLDYGGTNSTKMTLDSSGNLGLGVTPSAWSGLTAYQVKSGSFANNSTLDRVYLLSNAYYNAGFKYVNSNPACRFDVEGTSGSFAWYTAPSGTAGTAITFTQAMTLDASGNFLLGTTTSYNAGGFSKTMSLYDSSSVNISLTNASRQYQLGVTGSAIGIYDGTAGAWRMYLDSSGNLGIGTTSPGSKLQVQGLIRTSSSAAGIQIDRRDTSASAYTLYSSAGNLQFYNGTSDVMTLDTSGNLLVGTANSSGTSGSGAAINPNANGVRAVSSASTNASETYSMYSTGASAYRFYVDWGGTIHATSTTISAISDIRYKENVRDLDVGLDKIMELKPRLYDWKEGKGANIKNARGFIAQEFEEVFPDLIDEWKDPAPEGEEPYKSVRQDLIPVLVKAIQEQQALIQTLTERITALESK